MPSPTADLAGADAPVRALFERMSGPASQDPADLDAIGQAVLAFAGDREYLARWTRRLGPTGGSLLLHAVPGGPRLTIVRRPPGHLSAVHDHGTWVAIAPIAGRELHRRYEIVESSAGSRPEAVEVRSLEAGSFVTLVPPSDIHDHGHVLGEGEPADVVIVTGADQTRFSRTEWDTATGRSRVLAPGEAGRWLASEPFAGA